VKAFNKNDELKVKRGKYEVVTTVKGEVGKQLEVYLSNAGSRMRSKNRRTAREPEQI